MIRPLFLVLAALPLLAACSTPPVMPPLVPVVEKPLQPRPAHMNHHVKHTGSGGYGSATRTITAIRPDATGHFPGDFDAAWNGRTVEGYRPDAFPGHYGYGSNAVPHGTVHPMDARRPFPRTSAYEAHDAYRPPMDCGIVSQSGRETHVGERFMCFEK